MVGCRRAVAERAERRARVEDLQRLDGAQATGRRRRAPELMAAIGAGARLAPDRLVVAQIVDGEEAAARLHRGDDLVRDRPLVEAGGAALAERLERARQLGAANEIVLRGWLAAGKDERAQRIVGGERRHLARRRRAARARVLVGGAGKVVAGGEAEPGQADRRLRRGGEAELAVGGRELGEAGRLAGDGDGEPAPARLGGIGFAVDDEHVARGPGRRGLAEVEHAGALVLGAPHDREAAAAEAARLGIDDAERQRRSDGSVGGVAPFLQNFGGGA